MADETPNENPSKEPPSQFDGIKKKMKGLHASPKVNGMKRFFFRHAREVIGGVLVLFGIISDFVSWMGGMFVACGIVLGFYQEIRCALSNMQYHYAKNGPIKNALLCGLLLFFIVNMFPFTVSFLLLCVILTFVIDAPASSCSKDQCPHHQEHHDQRNSSSDKSS